MCALLDLNEVPMGLCSCTAVASNLLAAHDVQQQALALA